MRKRFVSILLSAAMLLSGCQIAIPEETMQVSGTPETEDMIVGMLVTLDSVEPNPVVNEEALHLISNQGKRIYATLQEETYESYDGTMRTTHRMAFPEGLGLTFMGYEITPENLPTITEEETYWTNSMDDGIRMNGTIYISDKIGYVQYFYNPVRQDSEGRVYLTAGTGLSSNVTEGAGMKNWHDLSDEYTITANGETRSYRADITIGVETIVLPERYTFYYMDENHLELGRDVYAPSDVPQEIYPLADTAYILVEESSRRKDSAERSFRTIYSRGQNEVLDIYIPGEDFVCTKSNSKIVW